MVKVMKVLAVLLFIVGFTDGYKILLLLPFPSPSHFLMFKVFIKELIDRGHEVTSITAFPYGETLSNYKEVLITPKWSFEDGFSQESIYEMKYSSKIPMLMSYWSVGLGSTEHALRSPAVEEFIKNDKSKFDLILAEQFFQESMLMFAHKYKAPIVTISTYGFSDFMDRAMGSLTPYSFVPHIVLSDYSDGMSFMQRSYNLIFSMADVLIRKFYYIPQMDRMARKYFSNIDEGKLPSVADLEKSISVILINNHFAMVKPRPMMPGMINIAGCHIKPVKPLPDDLKTFFDEAEHGFIFMSLGSFMQSSKMPKEKMATILRVFGSLKQRVIWKFESDDLPDLPPNVMVQKWLPQSDILAHPNLILFIAHGGLFGTIETSFRGVPTLFIPFFGDQYRNAKLASSQGYAEMILFSDIKELSLKSKIQLMISNRSYNEKAKEISKLLNDNPMEPMDEAIYWIEYVVRNNGAVHLKSSAVHLPWFKYLLLDVAVFYLLLLWVAWKALKAIVKKILPKRTKIDDSLKKKN